ncbi:beta-propeller fold lactonase family protein [Draconibacterium halophilum]|uniref:Beta-propeller fold lactonase family protein n=1 Tax=Draconibacterium halophilum TaxID=2706887 RepID=A0A6C0RF49_9BACT|nr:beta-propeller fold lactonase family protein [Draconibacterium halophilum]QIA07701.1 beta-propeller fold lactonase family protein [Draconibacterium halophilum]
MNRKKIYFTLGVIILFALLIFFPGRQKARQHVNYMTAVEDHPLKCTSCHLHMIDKDRPIGQWLSEDYYSPINLAVSNNGQKLFVVAQDANELLLVDVNSKNVEKHIPVGKFPHSVVFSKDGRQAFVSNQWSDNVMIVDLTSGEVSDTITTGNGPSGVMLSTDEQFLYVVNTFSSDLTVIDLGKKQEVRRLPAAYNPTGIVLSPNGSKLYVSGRRAHMVPFGEPTVTAITEFDGEKKIVRNTLQVKDAYLMENMAFTPDGELVLMSLIRPKNLLPTVQVERGWMMNHGFGIIEQTGKQRVVQFLLDEPNSYFSDPYDIVVSKDGKRAFISSTGVNHISVVNLDSIRSILQNYSEEELNYFANDLSFSRHYIEKRIPTGAAPKGLALSDDGTRLYVANQLDDQVGVVDLQKLENLDPIDLGGPKKISVNRRGRQVFVNAGGTFQNQYSCYTCHPDYHEDGLVYNMAGKGMGRNVTNTQSLREINHTAPFKWNGKNQTVYKQDGMRFSTVLTRTEAFSYPDLDALASFIMTGIKNPPNLMYNPNGELTASQKRGKKIFERTEDNFGKEIPMDGRCVTCHPAPFYTNFQFADVGTLSATDDTIQFDTPHLNNIFASAPYLHDGRATTLEEIWTLYGGEDQHGVVNDMTKMQLNDLVNYLKSLRSAKLETPEQEVLNSGM